MSLRHTGIEEYLQPRPEYVYSPVSYYRAKADMVEAHHVALEALAIYANAQRTAFSFEAFREGLENNESTASLVPILDECQLLGKTMEEENISVEDLFMGKSPRLTATMEAIHRSLFEKIGKTFADASKRVGEATGADQRFFDEMKKRHSDLDDAIKHANSGGTSVDFKCYSLDGHKDAQTLIKAANNASVFYANFNKNYQRATEAYLDRAIELAIEINETYVSNMKTVGQFLNDVFIHAWIGVSVALTIFLILLTGPFVILLFPLAIINALPYALFATIVWGLIAIPLPAIRSKGVPNKDCEKILALMGQARKNYEGWRDSMKHLIPGKMPGQAGFEIEGGKAEFDYHRSKESMSISLTQSDAKKLNQIAGDILHNHRTPSDYRLNSSRAAGKLDSVLKNTNYITRGGKEDLKNRHGAFQEKNVKECQTMLPVHISRYMAELADSLLDAVEGVAK